MTWKDFLIGVVMMVLLFTVLIAGGLLIISLVGEAIWGTGL